MEMGDCLSTVCAGVEDEPVTIFGNTLSYRQSFRHRDHVSNQQFILGLQFVDRGNVPVGNNEDMRAGNGMVVAKGRHQVIAVDDLGGRFTGNDLAEDTRHGYE